MEILKYEFGYENNDFDFVDNVPQKALIERLVYAFFRKEVYNDLTLKIVNNYNGIYSLIFKDKSNGFIQKFLVKR